MGWGHDKVNIYQDIVLVVYQGGKMNCTLHSTEAMAAPPAQNFVLMQNWETNQVVGWWAHTERNQLGIGLVSDYFPEFEAQQREADGSVVAVPEMVPHHEHRNGYFFLRLPGPKPNKVLFHRQLWQDLNNGDVWNIQPI